MIKLVPDPTFKAQVPFTVPGATEPAIIEIEFAHRSPVALDAWWQSAKGRPVATGMVEVIKGWSGVVDETGAEVPYSPAALAQFIGNSSTRGEELLRAYLKELTESRLKN
jgi:hypothetical protein